MKEIVHMLSICVYVFIQTNARGPTVLFTSSPDSHDAAVHARLWTVSKELTGVHFPALIDRD
jgi:hypothetical protein